MVVRLAELGEHLRAVHIVRVPRVVDAQAVRHEHVPVRRILHSWPQSLRIIEKLIVFSLQFGSTACMGFTCMHMHWSGIQ